MRPARRRHFTRSGGGTNPFQQSWLCCRKITIFAGEPGRTSPAAAHNFAQVMTTVTFRIPTHRALRGGMMIGAEVISLAELMQ
jgi:hypothetical protein